MTKGIEKSMGSFGFLQPYSAALSEKKDVDKVERDLQIRDLDFD